MLKNNYRTGLVKGLVKSLKLVGILVFLSLLVSLLLSGLLSSDFKSILGYFALGVGLVGVLSIVGSLSPVNRYWNASSSGTRNNIAALEEDLKFIYAPYGFLVLMGLSAAILFIIYLLI